MTEHEQYNELFTNYHILPVIYRQLFHYLCFLYNLIKRKNCTLANKFLMSSSKTRNNYVLPIFKTDLKKYSFSTISTKMLNLFLDKFISDKKNNVEKRSIKNFLIFKLNNNFTQLFSFIS